MQWHTMRERRLASTMGAPEFDFHRAIVARKHQEKSMSMDVIDYRLFGDDMQFVEVELDPGEAAVGEAGTMFYMEDGIVMDTIFGDGSAAQQGFMGKLMGAGKRLLTGESLFTTVFVNQGQGKKRVAFGAPYPGKIIPVQLGELGGTLLAQKDSFLCAAKGVSLGIAMQKRLGAGFFGGEGFILQKLEGDGYAFIHAGGALIEKVLSPGETLRVDTGCVVAFQPSVDFDIQFVGNVKSALFGGEGLFFATLRGPGRVWLQSLPLSRLANRIVGASKAGGGNGGEQGSVLGGFSNMFERE
ncbi:TIGR00266 family protein [Chitinimonas sp.]|uniref:TIGR00266 family protein n=1 Tax=Chitinimonas sp. TaxID=1934313 RepID=UPI0035B296F6